MKFCDFDNDRFIQQRKILFSLIDLELERDSHHKSYEGALEIVFNNRFASDEDYPIIYIRLSCYVGQNSGRSCTFDSQDDLDTFLNEWVRDLNESDSN